MDTTFINITVNSLPSVSIAGNHVICKGFSTSLTAAGVNTYVWSNTSTTSSIAVSPAFSTVYIVTGTGANGCIDTSQVKVIVNTLPLVSISGKHMICKNSITNLTVSGAVAYTWSNGSNNAILEVKPVLDTTLSVVGTNEKGCSDTAMFTISINDMPLAIPNFTSQVWRDTLYINDKSTGEVFIHKWKIGSVSIDNAASVKYRPSEEEKQKDTITVTLIVNNIYGCEDTLSKNIRLDEITTINEFSSSKSSQLIIYPNPVVQELTLRSAESGIFSLYDLQSKVIMVLKIIPGEQKIDVRTLNNGIYLYHFRSDEYSQRGKIIKE